jgi:chitin synthase
MDIDLAVSDKSPIAYSQYSEYISSHYNDKTFEALFNNQTVLPGAFSMLRWDAIKGQPTEKFLRGLEYDRLSLFKCNMFLAEDRIMCWHIIIQQ